MGVLSKKAVVPEQELELFERLKGNPVLAAEKLLIRNSKPLRLATHQRVALKQLWNGTSFNLLLFGRGMSKTFLLALYLTLHGIFHPGRKYGIVSASYRQAQLVFNEIIQFYTESPFLQNELTKQPTKAPTECSMDYKHGGFVKALPIGQGNLIRGYRFNVLAIDELAQVDPDVIDLTLIPFLNVSSDPMNTSKDKMSNQLIMASTAFYQFNHLYEKYNIYKEMIEMGSTDYSLLEFTYHDAPDGFVDQKILNYAKSTMPKVKFLMEYENYFPSDSEGFFPASLVHSVSSRKVVMEERGQDGYEYVLGFDVARQNANAAFCIIRLGKGFNKLVRVYTMNKKTFPEMIEKLKEFIRDYNIVRIAIDEGGGGLAIKDYLAEGGIVKDESGAVDDPNAILPVDEKEFPNRKGRRILDVVHPSSRTINEMNHSLRAEMENKQIIFPSQPIDGTALQEVLYEEVDALKSELISIVISPLKNGFFNFDTPTEKMKKDRYSAFLLACKAARDYRGLEKTTPKQELAGGFWIDSWF